MANRAEQERASDGPVDGRTPGGVDHRRLVTIGLCAAFLPVLLVYAGYEGLALSALVVVSPFALAVWLRLTYPHLAGGRVMRLVAAVLLASLLVVFAEYWILDREHRVDSSQLLGLAMAGVAGMGVALLGGFAGRWMARRTQEQDRLRSPAGEIAMSPSGPGADVPNADDRCEECPVCGDCYAPGTSRCLADGAALVSLNVPPVLANRYQLERRLGRGGMGTVYAAMDTALHRRVAAKVVREDLVGLPGASERFQREAQAAAAFNHPNVVTVYDYGVSRAQAFLVMELLSGRTLRDAMRTGERIDATRALALLRDITAAVESAHRQQLIHRDLKPENIFLVANGSDERAKVLDFGLATLLAPEDQEPRIGHSTGGALFGTPLYMAPEQLRGENPHPSWDLWALAVIGFEMLTGSHPFSAMTLAVEADAGEPTADSPLTLLPRECQGFFARALAIERARRPQSAALFLAGLEHSLDA